MERFDADKDGKLSEKEMSELPARNKQRFAEWDADKDGSLTKEEITAGMKKSFDRSPRESDRPRPARPARPKTDN
jgi:Ca2+-binding EF-hand superfamily protein